MLFPNALNSSHGKQVYMLCQAVEGRIWSWIFHVVPYSVNRTAIMIVLRMMMAGRNTSLTEKIEMLFLSPPQRTTSGCLTIVYEFSSRAFWLFMHKCGTVANIERKCFHLIIQQPRNTTLPLAPTKTTEPLPLEQVWKGTIVCHFTPAIT